MKMHDELRERLRRGAEVPAGAPEMERIRRRAGARRARRLAGAVVASALLAAAVVVPLIALLAVGGRDPVEQRPGDGESASSVPPAPSLDPTQNVLGIIACDESLPVRVGIDASLGAADGVAVCEEVWRTGVVDPAGAVWVTISDDLRPHDGDLPMVACSAPGVIRVVAGTDESACTDAGLSPLPEGWEETFARWGAAHDAFTQRAFPETSGSCTDGAAAIRVVREELDAHGFTAWRVVDSFEPNSPNGSCAAYGVDYADMQVTIVNDTVS